MKTKINDKWLFWDKSDSFALIWNVPENAEKISVPHDPMAGLIPDPQSINGNNTGYVDGQVYNYVKMLKITDDSKQYKIQFDGIYRNAMIYINGQYVGQNKFGYNSFKVDITDYINYDCENELRVIVKNNNDGSRWYAGGGIYRDVYLIEDNHLYLEDIKLTTKQLIGDDAIVKLDATLINNYPKRKNAELEIKFGDEYFKYKFTTISNSHQKITKELLIPNAKLWSANSPNLYDVIFKLNSKQISSEYKIVFGIRTISCDYKNGLLINGHAEKLRGACIHHDSGILGSKTYFDYEYFKIKKLKDAGFNAIRIAHNPISSVMLEACDLIGMYVVDETFDMWHRHKSNYDFSLDFEQDGLSELKLMIDNDYNHSSVIMYSLGNEIPDIGMNKGIETLTKLNTYAKKLDKSRPTLISINGVFATGEKLPIIIEDVLKQKGEVSGHVNNFMQVMDKHMNDIVKHDIISNILDNAEANSDILGYNYMHGRYELDSDSKRVIVGSETYPPQISSNWKTIVNTNNIIGDFTWTGWDYIGEAGVGIPAYNFGEGGFGAKFPARLSYCGDFDLIGTRRPLSYYRQIVFGFRTNPYITIINPNANRDKLIKTPWVLSDAKAIYYGNSNQLITAEVYSAGDTVKLYLNDSEVGEVEVTNNIATIDFTYKIGQLRAESYQGGKLIGTHQLNTPTNSNELKINVITGKKQELKFIQIYDTQIQSSRGTELEITNIEGTIIGFGNGDPKNVNSYVSNKSYTYDGHAMVVVSSNTTSLEINQIKYSV